MSQRGWAGLDAQLLRMLRGFPVHLTAGDLASQLNRPLDEIETAIESLRGAGFDIENRPGLGCRLVSGPDRILADDLWSRMDENPLVREILAFEQTGSTNDVAMRLGREGHPGGIAVFAERQTAGRGRFGRKWDSADYAGLWFSLLLRPDWPVAQWPSLTTWVGVGVARALDAFAKSRAQLKWPNDVLLGGKKAAGILIESAADQQGRLFAVAGIGVNVNQEEFPEEIQDRAVSIRQCVGSRVDRAAVAAAILSELDDLWPAATDDFPSIVAEAADRSALLGKWVRLQSGADLIEGVAEGLDAAGQLLLRISDGTLRAMTAGEVTSQTASPGA